MNEAESKQTTNTEATETKLDQLFDWWRYSTFKQIQKSFYFLHEVQAKQKGPLFADKIQQSEQNLFPFV